jgi:hypothetical protein
MTKKALSIALGMMLMAAGSANASRTDESDVQAPRGVVAEHPDRSDRDLQSPRGQGVEAPRSHEQDIQSPRGEVAERPDQSDRDLQAPRGLSRS